MDTLSIDITSSCFSTNIAACFSTPSCRNVRMPVHLQRPHVPPALSIPHEEVIYNILNSLFAAMQHIRLLEHQCHKTKDKLVLSRETLIAAASLQSSRTANECICRIGCLRIVSSVRSPCFRYAFLYPVLVMLLLPSNLMNSDIAKTIAMHVFAVRSKQQRNIPD